MSVENRYKMTNYMIDMTMLQKQSVVIASAAVDITLENQDNHSPFFHEGAGHDASLDGHKVFTKDELSKYNGDNPDLPIYVAIKGIVFDVSEAKKVYGPGGSYNKFSGKDASRAIAKWSMEEEDLNDNLEDLSEDDLNRLDGIFKKLYLAKYPKVGFVEGHEPKHEDNLTVKTKKHNEL
ncbi:hypothetical protein OS493_007466 [Desmophyllum pertusum]|uniref:Cytochrome b5 heme-binding domain-containing protein n=1 Tax=Desmophyllum pertusum TaxID=174260 RepID=A0A9X0CUZ8_9CNID|nr:hypothetical protein OS493_007466 [Desmophyllum pertusum]